MAMLTACTGKPGNCSNKMPARRKKCQCGDACHYNLVNGMAMYAEYCCLDLIHISTAARMPSCSKQGSQPLGRR